MTQDGKVEVVLTGVARHMVGEAEGLSADYLFSPGEPRLVPEADAAVLLGLASRGGRIYHRTDAQVEADAEAVRLALASAEESRARAATAFAPKGAALSDEPPAPLPTARRPEKPEAPTDNGKAPWTDRTGKAGA